MPDQHAKISPSAFARIRACPASLLYAQSLMAQNVVKDESSAAAEEGTARHEAVERILNGELLEAPWTAENGITLDAEGLEDAEQVVVWVLEQEFDLLWTEERLPIGRFLGLNDPDLCWGTSDIIGMKDKSLFVIDAKFGFKWVDAKDNDQARLYSLGALGVIEEHGFVIDEVWNVIIQPKAGGVKRAKVTPDYLKIDFKEDALGVIARANMEDAPFKPGEEQCRFCPASGVCRAQVEEDFEALDDMSQSDIDVLSGEEIAHYLDRADHIIATVKAIKFTAMNRLAAGQEIPGWTREQGNANRTWKDVEETLAFLSAEAIKQGLNIDDLAPRKPGTQGYLKKVLGKDVVESLTYKPKGQITLSRIEDAKNPLDAEFKPL